MTIRRGNINDLSGVVKLFDAYRVWYRKESDPETATDFLRSRITNDESIIFVAEHGSELLGFTQLYPIFSSTRMKRMWLLNDLFVSKDFRGQGLGKQLIAAAKKYCIQSEACGILLETETSNLIGNKLYQNENFHLEANNFYFWTNEK